MKTSKKLAGIAIAVMAMIFLPTASAQAAPFTISIDNAIMDLGALSGVRAIDSSLEPPDPPATLSGDLTGETVNVPKANFIFPTKSAEVSSGITADIDMEANEDITGTYDAGNGKLVLAANLKATVAISGSNCVISPIVLELSTDNATPYVGEPFEAGIEGNGVFSDSWTGLPPVTGGGFCSIVAGLISGPGGIAMSHGVYDFKTCQTAPLDTRCDGATPPTVAPKIISAPAVTSSTDVASFSFDKGDGETADVAGFLCRLDSGAFEACNSGNKTYTGLANGAHKFEVRAVNSMGEGPVADHSWTVNVGPPSGKAKFGALKAKPKNKKVRRGKSVTITARVKNTGDAAAAGVKICVKAPKKLVKVKRCVNKGRLAAGATAVAKFKVKVKPRARKKAKATLTFKATGNGLAAKTARTTIRVG